MNKYLFVFDLTRYHTLALSAVCIHRYCYVASHLTLCEQWTPCVSRHQKERNLKWKWLNGGKIAEQIKHRPNKKKSSPRWDKTYRFVCENECVCVWFGCSLHLRHFSWATWTILPFNAHSHLIYVAMACSWMHFISVFCLSTLTLALFMMCGVCVSLSLLRSVSIIFGFGKWMERVVCVSDR